MSSDDPCSEAEDRIESWLVRLIGVVRVRVRARVRVRVRVRSLDGTS